MWTTSDLQAIDGSKENILGNITEIVRRYDSPVFLQIAEVNFAVIKSLQVVGFKAILKSDLIAAVGGVKMAQTE